MIKNTLIFLMVLIFLSGCNLVISYLDSTIPKDNVPEPTTGTTVKSTPEPTTETTVKSTPEPTTGTTENPTPEPTTRTTENPTPEPTTETTGEPTPEPLVYNGDFERGDTDGWTGKFVVTPASANTGSYGAQMNKTSSISQIITGLTPNKEYILSYYSKLKSITGAGSIVLHDYCDLIIEQSFVKKNAKWNYNTIPFTLSNGATNLSITFYCTMVNVNIDDVVLEVND